MSAEIILKDTFKVPTQIERADYYLEVLAPKHNEIDFEAWTSSKESLKGIFGPLSGWPGEVDDLDYNLKDLENHLREFNEREAYTYTILNLEKNLCIGCVYIRPCPIEEYDCRVDFWFRDSHKHFESEFLAWINQWLSESWDLTRAVFPGRTLSWKDYYREK